jgi:anthranilate synthase component 1
MLAQAETVPQARFVQRRLPSRLDPYELYAALAGGPDTALFEGMSGPTLLMQHAAVRVECRGDQVRLQALSANGESLLASLRPALGDRVTGASGPILTARFPLSRSLDSEQRLLAPSPLHAIRSLLHSAMPGARSRRGARLGA